MNPQSQAEALENAPLKPGDTAKFWREQRYGDLECLAARFRTHVYERHTHETYVIGCITAGCKRFELAGARYAARARDLCFVPSDVVQMWQRGPGERCGSGRVCRSGAYDVSVQGSHRHHTRPLCKNELRSDV